MIVCLIFGLVGGISLGLGEDGLGRENVRRAREKGKAERNIKWGRKKQTMYSHANIIN